MKDLFYPLFFNSDSEVAVSSDDEVDQLFLQLEQVAPPSGLVDTILASVAHLPRPEFLSGEDEGHESWNAFGALIVPTSHLQPS